MRAIFLTVILLLGGTAHAQDRSPIFTVPKVPVQAEAATAAAAQAEAQSQGRKVAMDLLLRRLTAEGDWQYLPRLAAGRPAPAAAAAMNDPFVEDSGTEGALPGLSVKRPVSITPEALAQVEQSFAVFDEKSSRSTYRASITYRFKPDEVRRLLSEARLPYSEEQSREALVLPILETSEGVYLWEAKNPWARAWLARPLVNELTPLRLPRGDQRDVDFVTAAQAKRMDAEPLADIARRYGAGQVVIAHGKLSEEDGQYRLYVRLIDGYLDGRGSNRRRIDANNSGALYDDEDGFDQRGRAVISAGEPGEVLAEAFFRGSGDDFPALAQRAVESTVAKYARDWKERTLVDHSEVRRFELIAFFEDLGQWAEIRTALGSTPLVQDFRPGAFTNESAVIDLTVIGDEQQFALAMRQDGLTVWPSETGWSIAEAGLAREIQARPAAPSGGRDDRAGLRRGYDSGGPPDVRYGTDPYQEGRGADDGLPELPDDLFGPAGRPAPGSLERPEPAETRERSIDDVLIDQL